MIFLDILYTSLSIATGYLIGAFLPGYLLPLWVKKMDIRKIGDGNPGVINVSRHAGTWLGLFTLLYDLPKSLLAILIVLGVLKFPLAFAYLAGLSAVLGHKFPFHLGFHDGRGIAAMLGLFLFIFIKILIQNFPLPEIIPLCLFILVSALRIILATHGKSDFFTVFIFPLIGLYMLIKLREIPDLVFILAM
jgi:glycerol-3-phosphate acyltransferase PlsY